MLESDVIQANAFLTVTIGILVLFLGRRMNSSIPFLTNFSIPEAVSGGVVCSLLITAFYALSGVTIDFDLTARNILLVYFFTTIGINASLKDLFNGGKPLVILLFITIGFMVLQNLTGISVINLFGESAAVGTLTGSVSLIGGHGTAIAWAPKIQSDYGVSNAIEIGMASATFGLVLASMLGGPIAKHLIQKFKLEPSKTQPHDVGLPEEKEGRKIDAYTFLDSILAIHISIILGFTLDGFLNEMGVQLPLFVSCLFAGIILTNLIPNSLKTQLYKAMLDSHASEHGARMTAMHKATDNATELKKELQLFYNKARQATITNEILEIVGGAEALANG